MTRTAIVVVSALAALLAAVSIARAGSPTVVTFVAVNQFADQGETKIVIHDIDVRGAKTIGSDVLTCQYATGKCKAVFSLGNGRIWAAFTGTGTAGSGKVTGGTGAYRGVKGTFSWKNVNSSGSRTTITLTLS